MYLFKIRSKQLKAITIFDKQRDLLPFLSERHCIDTPIYFVTSSASCYSKVMKRNLTLVTLISENDKARLMNTLFKVKLLALVVQPEALL